MEASWPDPKTVSTSLGALEYHDIGQGPPLVLLHLILGGPDHWQLVVPHLSTEHRCIVPVMPMGCHRIPVDAGVTVSPETIAAAVAELIDQLDLQDVTLVGNDTGGAIAQIIATAHGERVADLILTNCDMYDQFPPALFGYFKLLGRLPGGVWQLAQALRIPVVWKLPIAFGWLTNDIRGDLVRRWGGALRADRLVRRDVRDLIRRIDPETTRRAAELLRTGEIPVLLAWGADDRVFAKANAERMVAEVPGAELILIDDCRALVPWDQPERLASIIARRVAVRSGS